MLLLPLNHDSAYNIQSTVEQDLYVVNRCGVPSPHNREIDGLLKKQK